MEQDKDNLLTKVKHMLTSSTGLELDESSIKHLESMSLDQLNVIRDILIGNLSAAVDPDIDPESLDVVGSNYPCGPCELPLKCTCGFVLTSETVVDSDCGEDCEICNFCSNSCCPVCGEHVCCGGCI